jgi:predicted Zn finger-like uncharacterized protein
MRLICPNCDAQYEVDDAAIPPGGRDVQCSNCGHAWFQVHVEAMNDEDEAEEAAPVVNEAAEPPDPPTREPAAVEEAAAPPAGEPVADTAETAPPEVTAAAPPVRRTLDENLLTILREEAAREAAERRAESERGIETQPDLGPLDEGARTPPPRVIVNLSAEPDPPVTERPNPRRDLLPDIEEINSTLRPGAEARDEAEAALLAAAPKPRAFRTGFFSVLLIALVLVILYVMAPQLAARYPATEPAMTAYVATVDSLRVWLDGVMQSAAGALRGFGGEG